MFIYLFNSLGTQGIQECIHALEDQGQNIRDTETCPTLCKLPFYAISPPSVIFTSPHFHLPNLAHDSVSTHLSWLLAHFHPSLLQSWSFGTSFRSYPHPSHCFILPALRYFLLLNFLVPYSTLPGPYCHLPSTPVKLPSHFSVLSLTHQRPYSYLLSYNLILHCSALSCFLLPFSPFIVLVSVFPCFFLHLSFHPFSLFLSLSLLTLPLFTLHSSPSFFWSLLRFKCHIAIDLLHFLTSFRASQLLRFSPSSLK